MDSVSYNNSSSSNNNQSNSQHQQQTQQQQSSESTETANTVILSPGAKSQTDLADDPFPEPEQDSVVMGNSEIKSEASFVDRQQPDKGSEEDDNIDTIASRYRAANQNSLYSASIESNVSNDSVGFYSTMPTTESSSEVPSHVPVHQIGTSNSRFMSYVRSVTKSPNHCPPPRVEPISINRKKDSNAPGKPNRNGGGGGNADSGSSSFSETISHFASSLISGRLKHSISGTGNSDGPSGVKRRPFEYDRSSSSERPLTMPPSGNIFAKVRQNTVAVSRDIENNAGSASARSRKPFKRQDTPRVHDDIDDKYNNGNGDVGINITTTQQKRRPSPIRHGKSMQQGLRSKRSAFSADSSSSGSQSFGTGEHFTPPSISIVCTDDPEPGHYDFPSSPNSPSYDSFTPRNFGSIDTDSRDTDTPIMDEFAQFLNASIHPPNELSVPRCYPDPTPYQRSLLAAPMTAPNSRRSSASSRGAFIGNGSRSLSLGYHQVRFSKVTTDVLNPLGKGEKYILETIAYCWHRDRSIHIERVCSAEFN